LAAVFADPYHLADAAADRNSLLLPLAIQFAVILGDEFHA
jgi:hypothetical protein